MPTTPPERNPFKGDIVKQLRRKNAMGAGKLRSRGRGRPQKYRTKSRAVSRGNRRGGKGFITGNTKKTISVIVAVIVSIVGIGAAIAVAWFLTAGEKAATSRARTTVEIPFRYTEPQGMLYPLRPSEKPVLSSIKR